mmetsp:Transcript_77193/g.168785  ORF Transcript_77193/g.168785 Transcript_77193/m.168785 type:complete len:264 (+) Transcript_77193:560-1351(+)
MRRCSRGSSSFRGHRDRHRHLWCRRPLRTRIRSGPSASGQSRGRSHSGRGDGAMRRGREGGCRGLLVLMLGRWMSCFQAARCCTGVMVCTTHMRSDDASSSRWMAVAGRGGGVVVVVDVVVGLRHRSSNSKCLRLRQVRLWQQARRDVRPPRCLGGSRNTTRIVPFSAGCQFGCPARLRFHDFSDRTRTEIIGGRQLRRCNGICLCRARSHRCNAPRSRLIALDADSCRCRSESVGHRGCGSSAGGGRPDAAACQTAQHLCAF